MSANANDVVCTLYERCDRESRHLAEIRDEMKNLSESYFRYCDLRSEREKVRTLLVKIYGVLGVFSPKVTPEFAMEISPQPLMSDEIRRDLKIWEILELFLSAKDDKASVGDFEGFLFFLGIESKPQAIESAIKTHPELFETHKEGRDKFLTLRTSKEV
jgi:hypothetical protein